MLSSQTASHIRTCNRAARSSAGLGCFRVRCEQLAERLASPSAPLHGKRASWALADNLACFVRQSTDALNRPHNGRALHHRCVLIVPLQGSASVCVDDRTIPLNPGKGLFVFPFQFHHYRAREHSRLLWLFLTFELVDVAPYEELRSRPFTLDEPLFASLAEVIDAYLGNHDELTVALLRVLLLKLPLAPVTQSPPAASTAHNLFAEYVNRMTQRPGSTSTLKALAAEIGISESHLRARFRASCGVSLGRHLRRMRLEKARGLLRLSTRRISEISELCGFNSEFSFSRAFRNTYGISPLAYRHRSPERTAAS